MWRSATSVCQRDKFNVRQRCIARPKREIRATNSLIFILYMKKFALVIIIGMALVCVVVMAFMVFWFWSTARAVAEYLPPNPSAADVSIMVTDAKVFKRFAVRHFRFTVKESADPAAAAKLFEAELNATGWEKISVWSNGRGSSGVWHHREKLGGNLYLVFTVVMLNETTHEYAGSMVTEPYWPHKR